MTPREDSVASEGAVMFKILQTLSLTFEFLQVKMLARLSAKA
jgi:hypothetical protein